MANLNQVFMLEWNLETQFSSVLSSACSKVFRSRDPRTANPDGTPATPRIESLVTINGVYGAVGNGHHYVSPDGETVFDAWQGELQTAIVTNRNESEQHEPPTHYEILGATRTILTPRRHNNMERLIPDWDNAIVSLVDIRETGCENSFDDEHSLDVTTLKWFILFQISQNAWPVNLS